MLHRCLFLPCLSSPYPLNFPLPFKFLQMFLPVDWGSPAQSCPPVSASPFALRLFLSLERAATSGEVANQPGGRHRQCFLAGFVCTVAEKADSLCYMQITSAHTCTRSLSRQVITCRMEWGFISAPVGDGSEHPWALEGFNNSS